MSLNKKPITLIVGSVLMILLGLARGLGGAALLLQGKDILPGIEADETILIILAVILILVGISEMVAAVGVFLLKRKFLLAGIIITLLFVIDGAVNGFFLFGKPGDQGTIINIIAAGIIISLLLAGRKSIKDKHQTLSN